MLNLLIRDGLIIGGTGNPGFYGAVGVEAEQVRILRGDLSGVQVERMIDAKGLIICPGFIDMHAHSGLVMLAEPHHEPKVRQGVTTELIGIDGCSYAPFRSHDDFHRFVEMNSGLDGNPPLPGQWSTVDQYLNMFNNRVAVNVAYILGNSPVRICAMGWEDRRPTVAELADMKAILREGIEEGGFGISTGLDYPPGSYADTAELIELSREAARLGGIYHTHVRYSLGDRFLDPFKEALDIGRQSGIPIHITHFYQRTTSPGGASRMLGLVEDAREEGMDVTFDSYPYAFSSTRLLIVILQWAHNGGPEHLKEVLRAPEMREQLRQEMGPRAASWQDMWLTYFKRPEHHVTKGARSPKWLR
jgi:N-acyl-D-amino-acid deacylase